MRGRPAEMLLNPPATPRKGPHDSGRCRETLMRTTHLPPPPRALAVFADRSELRCVDRPPARPAGLYVLFFCRLGRKARRLGNPDA